MEELMKVHLEITDADNGFVMETFVNYLRKERVVYEITEGLSNIDNEVLDAANILLVDILRRMNINV